MCPSLARDLVDPFCLCWTANASKMYVCLSDLMLAGAVGKASVVNV